MIVTLLKARLLVFKIGEPSVGFNRDYIRSLQLRSWFILFLHKTALPLLIFDAWSGNMRHNMAKGDGRSIISKGFTKLKQKSCSRAVWPWDVRPQSLAREPMQELDACFQLAIDRGAGLGCSATYPRIRVAFCSPRDESRSGQSRGVSCFTTVCTMRLDKSVGFRKHNTNAPDFRHICRRTGQFLCDRIHHI